MSFIHNGSVMVFSAIIRPSIAAMSGFLLTAGRIDALCGTPNRNEDFIFY